MRDCVCEVACHSEKNPKYTFSYRFSNFSIAKEIDIAQEGFAKYTMHGKSALQRLLISMFGILLYSIPVSVLYIFAY